MGIVRSHLLFPSLPRHGNREYGCGFPWERIYWRYVCKQGDRFGRVLISLWGAWADLGGENKTVDFEAFSKILNRPGGFREPGEPEEYCRGFQVFDKDMTGFIGVGQLRYSACPSSSSRS